MLFLANPANLAVSLAYSSASLHAFIRVLICSYTFTKIRHTYMSLCPVRVFEFVVIQREGIRGQLVGLVIV